MSLLIIDSVNKNLHPVFRTCRSEPLVHDVLSSDHLVKDKQAYISNVSINNRFCKQKFANVALCSMFILEIILKNEFFGLGKFSVMS